MASGRQGNQYQQLQQPQQRQQQHQQQHQQQQQQQHSQRQQQPHQQQQHRRPPQQQRQRPDGVAFLPATPAHLAAFEAIQRAAYPAELWEEPHVFASILRHGCSFVAVEGAATPHAHVVGYLLIHAVADPASPPPLNHPLLAPPAPAGQQAHLFVHDLCLLPSHHGGGLGARLARHALTHLAPRAASFSCVALPHAVRFWQRQGFAAARGAQQRLPAGYPHGSQLLVRAARHSGGGG